MTFFTLIIFSALYFLATKGVDVPDIKYQQPRTTVSEYALLKQCINFCVKYKGTSAYRTCIKNCVEIHQIKQK